MKEIIVHADDIRIVRVTGSICFACPHSNDMCVYGGAFNDPTKRGSKLTLVMWLAGPEYKDYILRDDDNAAMGVPFVGLVVKTFFAFIAFVTLKWDGGSGVPLVVTVTWSGLPIPILRRGQSIGEDNDCQRKRWVLTAKWGDEVLVDQKMRGSTVPYIPSCCGDERSQSI